MRERKRKITLLGSIIIFDHVLKVLALRSGIALINKGVGFGILLSCLPREALAKWGYLVILLIGLSVCSLFHFLRKKSAGVLLILAGGASNLLDRIFYGGVVDFVSFPPFPLSFPLFNFADISICLGVALALVDFLKLKKV